MSSVIIVMGVAGSGKTSVARAISARLGWRFIEADQFHETSAKQQMGSGQGLSDEQRLPWILKLCDALSHTASQNIPTVLACSALRKKHRDMFRAAISDVIFVYLNAPESIIRQRLSMRKNHYVNDTLCASQFADLQIPLGESSVVDVDADQGFTQVVTSALAGLSLALRE